MKKIHTLHNNSFEKMTNCTPKFNLIFIVKILIGLKKNKQTSKVTNNIQSNVETASRQPFSTY
jgi:hypothetical protein